jgi:hypothetical protein
MAPVTRSSQCVATFITESTFGLPFYRWPTKRSCFADINQWWRTNAAAGRASVLFSIRLAAQRYPVAWTPASVRSSCMARLSR